MFKLWYRALLMFQWIKKMFSKLRQEIRPEIFQSGCWYALRKRSGHYELYHDYGYERNEDDPWAGSGSVNFSHLTWAQVKLFE